MGNQRNFCTKCGYRYGTLYTKCGSGCYSQLCARCFKEAYPGEELPVGVKQGDVSAISLTETFQKGGDHAT